MLSENWSALIKRYRVRHGLTQGRMAAVFGVSQRTISRWERGDDTPSLEWQRQLRDLGWQPPGTLLASLATSLPHCPFPRALSRTQNIRLQALSKPAIEKRPSVIEWIGRDLALIATGVLQEMLDDRLLQTNIANREIASVVATTRSVLRTAEHERIGTYRTVVTYFFHEGTLYSDAVSTGATRYAARLRGGAHGRVCRHEPGALYRAAHAALTDAAPTDLIARPAGRRRHARLPADRTIAGAARTVPAAAAP